jgi:hypothetical protein
MIEQKRAEIVSCPLICREKELTSTIEKIKRRLYTQTSLRIEAKNHTPHSVLHKGMFLDLHNSAHR